MADAAYLEQQYADRDARERAERAASAAAPHPELDRAEVHEKAIELMDDQPWLSYETAHTRAASELRAGRR